MLGIEGRRVGSTIENTMFLLIPPRGCPNDCDFCSPKHIANPNIPLTPAFAQKIAGEIDQILSIHSKTNTAVLFNAGNILYGTEFGQKAGAIHESFWEIIPNILNKCPSVKTLEIEVRADDLMSSDSKKIKIRNRIERLSNELNKLDKQLRLIIALEYVQKNIIGQQNKFQENSIEHALDFTKTRNIAWISYAMLGGRIKHRTLTQQEAVHSAASTAIFAIEHSALEVIVNCQYIDPINQADERSSGIHYYIPSKEDILTTLLLVTPHLNRNKRIRICLDKEDIIDGTKGPADCDPNIDSGFKSLISGFDNAENQKLYFEQYLAR